MTTSPPKTEDELVYSKSQVERLVADVTMPLYAQIQWLKEQLKLAARRQYGASSEKTPIGQEVMVFNEAEEAAVPDAPEPTTETVTCSRRKTVGQRQQQLENLPVEEVYYRLPEDNMNCPHCNSSLHEIGADSTDELTIVPAVVKVVRHHHVKYACRHCQQHELTTPIVKAEAKTRAFPGSLASSSTVSYIATLKFVDGLPLYRQEQMFKRIDVALTRQTMSNWMLAGSGWLEHIYRRLHHHLLQRTELHADETELQVLKEPGRAATTKSYLWLYRSGRAGPPIVLYEYQPTRNSDHPRQFLARFTGSLHVDGYQGYNDLPGVTRIGCWAHARRYFVEAVAVLPPLARNAGKTPSHEGLAYCNRLFAIERELNDATAEERLAARRQKSKAVLDAFATWLDEHVDTVMPKSVLGKAITYCRKQWVSLNAFLQDGNVEIDNNRAERSIKPFVIGRKNWLFANTPRGAKASAIIYSIVETAKENGLNPYLYLKLLFDELPNINVKDNNQLDSLLPWTEAVTRQCSLAANSNA